MKGKIVWFGTVMLLLVLGFIMYVLVNLVGTPWGRIQNSHKMEAYLRAKYHTSFIVHHMSYNPEGFGYYGDAYPKIDPSVTFSVQQYQYDKAGFADTYPAAFWKSNKSKPLKGYIQGLFPNLSINSITVDTTTDETFGPHIPTHRSIHLEPGVHCLMTLQFEQNWFELNPAEQNKILGNIKEFASYLQSLHMPVFVEFFYHTDDPDQKSWKAIFITESGKIVQ